MDWLDYKIPCHICNLGCLLATVVLCDGIMDHSRSNLRLISAQESKHVIGLHPNKIEPAYGLLAAIFCSSLTL